MEVEWQSSKTPVEVNVYDFIDKTNGKAFLYGIYDVKNNKGWISVEISSDTASFAVSSIHIWWENEGKNEYENANKLHITADGGDSNGVRNRLWKSELQQFANDTNLEIHVSHFPVGTSKWNTIEHRLFSCISMNWKGKPLRSLLHAQFYCNKHQQPNGRCYNYCKKCRIEILRQKILST